jgi:pyridoxal phosphate enzyme (YggS family)
VDEATVEAARVRLHRVREVMAEACARAGRPEGSVSLLAVSKHQPIEAIVALIRAGQRAFGENYAQSLRDRATALATYPVAWHAIGPLQSNKVKYVARWAAGFHALDDLEIATLLGERREVPLPCWLEVNVADEATKHGVAPAAVPGLVEQLREVRGIALVGLMCMPPIPDDPSWTMEASRPHFRRLRELAEAAGLPELSMGTTADYPVAIEEGATWVRVGRELFGGRTAGPEADDSAD